MVAASASGMSEGTRPMKMSAQVLIDALPMCHAGGNPNVLKPPPDKVNVGFAGEGSLACTPPRLSNINKSDGTKPEEADEGHRAQCWNEESKRFMGKVMEISGLGQRTFLPDGGRPSRSGCSKRVACRGMTLQTPQH